MEYVFTEIAEQEDMGDVLYLARNFARAQGVVRQSYHFSPVFDSPVSEQTVIFADGFSTEWMNLYEEWDFRRIDPIPSRTLALGEPLLWTDAMKLEPNTREQDEYFRQMEQHDLIHGIGFGLYGPHCRDAYASVDFGRPIDGETRLKFNRIMAVAQAAQLRIAVLLNRDAAPITLSRREKQVLDWMVQAKSTNDIATILSLSPETVRTYAKRLYEKLGTSTRIGSVIRALKLNLVYSNNPTD